MTRQKLGPIYMWSIAALGLSLLLVSTLAQAPTDLGHQGQARRLIADGSILLVLTFLSHISPLETRQGSILTVGLAPLVGAVMDLPPWAVMWVACFGTLDERLPGRRIPWERFLFNRGMFVLAYGIPSIVLSYTGIHHPGSNIQMNQANGAWYLALALTVVAIIAINVGLVAAALTLLKGSSFFATARNTVENSWMTYIALPVVGYLIYLLLNATMGPQKLAVFLLYGPLLVYRASLLKQNRLDRWLRDSFIMQSRIVDKRDGQTFGHSQRVGELCEGVARLLHLSDEACNTIRVAGILHDLGKIAIPDSILLKPAKLTPEEYEIIKTHPVEGANILAEHPEQRGVAAIVRHHHEKWNGSGYPDGIKGEDIPIGARIVDACDAFDTITQARVFRPTVKTPAEAIRELHGLAGVWYDPAVVDALAKIVAARWGVPVEDAPRELRERPPGYSAVLKMRSFRLLWAGQAVSYFGDMMNTTGLAIMLLLLTGSASLVALGLIARALPTILFGLVAGPIVDRFNRQRLMVGSDLIRALLTVTIPFLAVAWLPGVFIVVFLIATAGALFNPAKQAIVPNLVPGNLLVRANSLISSSEKTMELLGYSIAGIIVAIARTWTPLFLIDAGTYLFSAVTLLGITDNQRVRAVARLHLFQNIVEGTRFILRSAALRATMGLTTMAAFFAGMTFPTLVVLAYYGPMHGGPTGYGFLEASIGAGAIIGAFAAPELINRFRAGALILAGVAGIGLSYVLAGLASNVAVGVAVLLIAGLASTVYYVPLISLTQREAPDFVRGRVMSSRFLLVQAGLLCGMGLAGPLSDRIGAPAVFVTAGGLLIAAAILGLGFKGLRDATLEETKTARLKVPAAG
jgi:putative nucleotidyltransferase with HDIG domain